MYEKSKSIKFDILQYILWANADNQEIKKKTFLDVATITTLHDRSSMQIGPDLLMQGTQQLCKPEERLELPADPHKVQPLQPETLPAITWCAKGRKKHTHISTHWDRFSFVSVW